MPARVKLTGGGDESNMVLLPIILNGYIRLPCEMSKWLVVKDPCQKKKNIRSNSQYMNRSKVHDLIEFIGE